MRRDLFFIIPAIIVLIVFPADAQWAQTQGLYGQAALITCMTSMDSVLFIGTLGAGIYRSTNGQNWRAVNEGLPMQHIYALYPHGTLLFAGGKQAHIYISADSGETWVPAMYYFVSPYASESITAFIVRSSLVSNPVFFAGSSSGRIYQSDDTGATWQLSASGLEEVHCFVSMRRKFFLTSTIFAGTNRGVFRYEDGQWTQKNNGLGDSSVYTMAALGDYVYAGTQSKIYRSADLGENWHGLAGPGSVGLAVWDANIFSCTSGNVSLSRDFGEHWEPAGWDPGRDGVCLRVARGYLYAGTTHLGVWRRPLAEMLATVDADDETGSVERFVLEQNYPNPFNPRTTITYHLLERSQVLLRIFNLSGKEVATLVDGVEDRGTRSVVFDANGLASGMYFYQLKCESFLGMRQFLLLR